MLRPDAIIRLENEAKMLGNLMLYAQETAAKLRRQVLDLQRVCPLIRYANMMGE